MIEQFWDNVPRAHARFKATGCSYMMAWKWSLDSTSKKDARLRHPSDALATALAEYACTSSSDSIIEHNFSRVKSALGENRLNGAPEYEENLVCMILSVPSNDKDLIENALKVWQEVTLGFY